jgi:anti-sigma factor (TIGR02949 family)
MEVEMKDRILKALRMLIGSREEVGCREVGRALQSYLDGEIDESQGRALAAHLDMCRNCGLDASVYREVRDNLRSLARPIPPETLERLREFSERLVSEGN